MSFPPVDFHWEDLATLCQFFAQQLKPGVLQLKGTEPGPHVAILAHTHGNEPAGLAALAGLLKDQALAHSLQRGQVSLVVNNLAAASKFYSEAQGQTETAAWRFIDQNMNRMPAPLTGTSYEVQRLLQLQPLYQSFDYVLDLHTTSADCAPMLITGQGVAPRYFPEVNIHLEGILDCLQGKPVIALASQAAGYVVECGAHLDPASWRRAQAVAWNFLQDLGLLDKVLREQVLPLLETYHVYQAVIFPDQSYTLRRILNSFEYVPAGTVLAEGMGPPVIVDRDSWVVMPPPHLQPIHPGSEFFFLATRSAPLEVSCALIVEQGRLLAARRSSSMNHAGQWELPGGKIEPGESPESCLRREIREELGIEIANLVALAPVEHTYPSQRHIRLRPYLCRWQSGSLYPREHSEVRWLTVSELLDLNWLEADRPVLDMYLQIYDKLDKPL